MRPDRKLSVLLTKAVTPLTKVEGPSSHQIGISTNQAPLPGILQNRGKDWHGQQLTHTGIPNKASRTQHPGGQGGRGLCMHAHTVYTTSYLSSRCYRSLSDVYDCLMYKSSQNIYINIWLKTRSRKTIF